MHKLGLVNYSIPYADGRRGKVVLKDQVVPAYALRPRGEDVEHGGRTEPGVEA